MRADRLVAVLLLLQARGQVTAREVADELEISERTARRDLDALAIAGLPVYSVRGRNGGWQLLGGARTDLSGLTAAEAHALFLVAGPAATATPTVKAALRKLVRALPEPMRAGAEAASNAVIVDPTAWEPGRRRRRREAPAHLEELQRAVVASEQVQLGYVARDGNSTTRIVHPLGLAAKAEIWYLIADTDNGLRTFRIDRVSSVEPTGQPAVRPADFDLEQAWAMVTAEVGKRWASFTARGVVDRDVVPILWMVFADRVRIGPARSDGRVEFELAGPNALQLAAEIAGLGGAVSITEPAEVREHLARIGRELSDLYSG